MSDLHLRSFRTLQDTIHWHTNEHDVGYSVDDPSTVGTFLDFWEAIDDLKDRTKEHLDFVASMDPDEPVRGSIWSAREEVQAIEEQLESFDAWSNEVIAQHCTQGWWFALNGGITVTELVLCADACEVPL